MTQHTVSNGGRVATIVVSVAVFVLIITGVFVFVTGPRGNSHLVDTDGDGTATNNEQIDVPAGYDEMLNMAGDTPVPATRELPVRIGEGLDATAYDVLPDRMGDPFVAVVAIGPNCVFGIVDSPGDRIIGALMSRYDQQFTLLIDDANPKFVLQAAKSEDTNCQ